MFKWRRLRYSSSGHLNNESQGVTAGCRSNKDKYGHGCVTMSHVMGPRLDILLVTVIPDGDCGQSGTMP